MAVHKQGDILIFGQRIHFVKPLQGDIFAAGDVAFLIFLLRAHIQKHRAGGFLILGNALMDVRLFEEMEEIHTHTSLVSL
jgi:hypothetical protein